MVKILSASLLIDGLLISNYCNFFPYKTLRFLFFILYYLSLYHDRQSCLFDVQLASWFFKYSSKASHEGVESENIRQKMLAVQKRSHPRIIQEDGSHCGD